MVKKLSLLKRLLKEETEKLEKLFRIKSQILEGATGFDVLYYIEQNYDLIYVFDKIEKSILKEIGNNNIIDESSEYFGKEMVKSLNSTIYSLELEIDYLEYQLRRMTSS
ncbi:MAG: hypothetical protein GF317_04195 [Candidatus Lokiarchaeota archaeon]|nr:hypothetical protein [Candidatus Lokiarchaeota archaeon]MBD3199088.1 hypothetical protein [Candidatus Lokiarchaeota archaeon]